MNTDRSDTARREIIVWFANPSEVTEGDFPLIWEFLGPEEREQCRRIRLLRGRHEYALAHLLVRVLLTDQLGVHPADWRFGRTRWNKPFLQGPVRPDDIDFSLSHAHDCVVCAVSHTGCVGVDVESLDRTLEFESIAHLCLTENEQRYLAGCSVEDSRRLFMETWTLKEALLKAMGSGLMQPPTEIEFDLATIATRQPRLVHRVTDSRVHSYFHLFSPSSRHVGALVSRSSSPESPGRFIRSIPICSLRRILSLFV
jgi:4'-phosphopantetheinyl transferase